MAVDPNLESCTFNDAEGTRLKTGQPLYHCFLTSKILFLHSRQRRSERKGWLHLLIKFSNHFVLGILVLILVLWGQGCTNSLTHHSTHRHPVETVVVAPIVFARVKVEAVRVAARTALAQRTRPIAAARTSAAETAIVAFTRNREENAVTVRTCYFIAIDTVLSRPSPSAIISQFILLSIRWHAPL